MLVVIVVAVGRDVEIERPVVFIRLSLSGAAGCAYARVFSAMSRKEHGVKREMCMLKKNRISGRVGNSSSSSGDAAKEEESCRDIVGRSEDRGLCRACGFRKSRT